MYATDHNLSNTNNNNNRLKKCIIQNPKYLCGGVNMIKVHDMHV
jgi:hypothetical protein